MTAWVVTHEAVFRGIAFASVFLAMAIVEVFVEERPRRVARRTRWLQNLGLSSSTVSTFLFQPFPTHQEAA